MFYRVKEVGGKFIPQKLGFLNGWQGIDKRDLYLWISDDHQWTYCKCDTLEEAREVIRNYKPKFHKP
jgi:hypothetical protein